MRYFLIAGERSGDLHGANLVNALKKEDPAAEFFGWGGDKMQKEGVQLLMHYKRLAIMGFVEVIRNYFTIRKMFSLCHKQIREISPDVIILIDYGGFNLRIARFASENGFRVFYYISPKIWAWNTKRAFKIKKYIDRMFVILPFEKDFYRRFDYEVDYVGNPVLDAVRMHTVNTGFTHPDAREIIALLPGSREQEVKDILPVMIEVAKKKPSCYFIVAAVNTLPRYLYDVAAGIENVSLVFEDTYNLLANSYAAVVTSGTATLETALFNVPQVVLYKSTSLISYYIAKMVIVVEYLSLVNLIANKKVITELVQFDCTADKINEELKRLTNDNQYREKIKDGYQLVRKKLGNNPVSETAARKMYAYLIAD